MRLKYRRLQGWLYNLLVVSGRYSITDLGTKLGCGDDCLGKWANGSGGYFPVDLIANLQRELLPDDRAEFERLFLLATPRTAVSGRNPLEETLDVVAAANALLECVRHLLKASSAKTLNEAMNAVERVQRELDEARDSLMERTHH